MEKPGQNTSMRMRRVLRLRNGTFREYWVEERLQKRVSGIEEVVNDAEVVKGGVENVMKILITLSGWWVGWCEGGIGGQGGEWRGVAGRRPCGRGCR